MSALTRFRDHCRAMADSHVGEWPPEPERRLWTQLADEIDTYLAGELEESAEARTPAYDLEQGGFDFGAGT